MFHFPSNTCGVNNDPINSFSDLYSSLNFQMPSLNHQQDHNALISQQDQIEYSAYSQPLPFNNLGFSSPFDHGQNLSLQSHIIGSHHHSQPLIISEPPEVSDLAIIGSKAKPGSSYSMKDPNKHEAQSVQHKILGKRSADRTSSSKNKSKNSKDRHSKIVTGTTRPRHRRMRLSIEVARQFFDLQDKLGFERASKTVQWLITKAKPEILKLMGSVDPGSSSGGTSPEMKAASSNSDSCEGGSGLDEVEMADAGGGSISTIVEKEKKKYSRPKSKRHVLINPLAKELRDKARERARERTKEKKMGKSLLKTKLDMMELDHQQYGPKMVANSEQDHHQRGYGHVGETGNNQNPNQLEALLQALLICDRRHESVWNVPTASTSAAPLAASAAAADQMQCDLLMNQLGRYWASLAGDNSSDQLGIPQEAQAQAQAQAQYSYFPF